MPKLSWLIAMLCLAPLAHAEGGAPAAPGLPPDLAPPPMVDAPVSGVPQLSATPALAPEALESQKLHFELVRRVGSGARARVSSEILPFVGQDPQPLALDAFYRRVGREDLAEEVQARRTTRTALAVGGVAVAVWGLLAGTVMAVNARSNRACVTDGPSGSAFETCVQTQPAERAAALNRSFLVGGGGLAVGTGLLLAAALYSPDLLSLEQNRALADEHNRKLEGRLPRSERRASVSRPALALRLHPLIHPHGGGLNLALTF
jgi:hypothetical protein